MMEVTWLFVSSQQTLVPFKMFQKQLAEESCVVFETLKKKKSYSHFLSTYFYFIINWRERGQNFSRPQEEEVAEA